MPIHPNSIRPMSIHADVHPRRCPSTRISIRERRAHLRTKIPESAEPPVRVGHDETRAERDK